MSLSYPIAHSRGGDRSYTPNSQQIASRTYCIAKRHLEKRFLPVCRLTFLRLPALTKPNRHMHIVRSAWGGLSALYVLPQAEPSDPYLDPNIEIQTLTAQSIAMNAGFPIHVDSPHYTRFMRHRDTFGTFLHAASASFQSESESTKRNVGEDHIDAVLAVIRAIDTFLIDYSVTRDAYASQKKSYEASRDLATTHSKQKHFPRNVWIKRAQVTLISSPTNSHCETLTEFFKVYHISRVHTHSLYRRRTSRDEDLLKDLMAFSLSSYTRARK